jgi:DedD protein
VDGPRTHYQISLTARQAMGAFVALLLALAIAFFFGLMAGMSGRAPAPGTGSAARGPAPEPLPSAETSPETPEGGFEAPSRTILAGQTPEASPSAPEPSPPPTLQSFDDGGGAPAPARAPATVPAAAAAAAARPPTTGDGAVWVQVASLTSAEQASALSARLGRHGFPARVLPAAGPRGKVYRVRVGPYSSEEEAGRAATRLSKQEKIRQPWIVPEGR